MLARPTDRLEDLAAWVLVALGLLAAVGAVVVGVVAHDAALRPGRLGDVTPVRVVLLADAPAVPNMGVSTVGSKTATPPTTGPPEVPVVWTAADGAEHTGELVVRGPAPAGTSVPAWLDREGRLTASAPPHALGAVALGVGTALTASALAWALLAGLWTAVRRATAARNDAAWSREWARVEPVWSRQVR